MYNTQSINGQHKLDLPGEPQWDTLHLTLLQGGLTGQVCPQSGGGLVNPKSEEMSLFVGLMACHDDGISTNLQPLSQMQEAGSAFLEKT